MCINNMGSDFQHNSLYCYYSYKEMEKTIAALKSQIASQKQIMSLQSGESLPSWQHHPHNVDIILATSNDACP